MRDRDVCKQHSGDADIGQHGKLVPEVQARFLQALQTGVGIAPAAAFAGISVSTVYNWIERGEQEQAAGKTSKFVEFLEGTTRTRASVRVRLAGLIAGASGRDWRAAAWMLERIAPDEFGRHRVEQHEHNHTGHVSEELLGGRQPVDIPLKTREAIIALIDEAEAEATAGDAEGL
jgi:hypothetical protein